MSRVRSERLRWGLTQNELAPLLCIRHVSQLSRIEHGTRRPSAVCLVAATLVFGKSAKELFPDFVSDVEDRIGPRALKLYQKVEKKHSMAAAKKRELLQGIALVNSSICM